MTCDHGLLRMTQTIIGILIFCFEIEQLNLSNKADKPNRTLYAKLQLPFLPTTIPSVSEKKWNTENLSR
jgi:hypothetical protein